MSLRQNSPSYQPPTMLAICATLEPEEGESPGALEDRARYRLKLAGFKNIDVKLDNFASGGVESRHAKMGQDLTCTPLTYCAKSAIEGGYSLAGVAPGPLADNLERNALSRNGGSYENRSGKPGLIIGKEETNLTDGINTLPNTIPPNTSQAGGNPHAAGLVPLILESV